MSDQGFYPGQTGQKVRAITAYAQGTDDPSVVATVGLPGTLYVQLNTTNVFQKQDSGRTTNWTAFGGGGGGTPGAPANSVQFNNAGAFGGDADFTFISADNLLLLGAANTFTSGTDSLASGNTNTSSGAITSSIVSGQGGSFTSVSESLVAGLAITFAGPLLTSIVAGNTNSMGASNSSLIVGSGHSIPAFTVANSVLAGNAGTFGADINRSLVAGATLTTTAAINDSIVAGATQNTGAISNSVVAGNNLGVVSPITASLVVGSSNIANTIQNSVYAGASNGVQLLRRSLIVGTLNSITAAIADNSIVGGASASITTSLTNSLVLGSTNSVDTNLNSLMAGNNHVLADISNSMIVGTILSATTVVDSITAGNTQTISSITNSMLVGSGGTIVGAILDSVILGNVSSSNGSFAGSVFGGNTRSYTGTGTISGSLVSGSGTITDGANLGISDSLVVGSAQTILNQSFNGGIVFGSNNSIGGNGNIVGGNLSVCTTSQYSIAIGSVASNIACDSSIAVGIGVTVDTSDGAIVVGNSSGITSSPQSIAVGQSISINSPSGKAAGFGGSQTITGSWSLTAGEDHTNAHNHAVIVGQGNVSGRVGQAVVGRYAASADADAQFAVGVGTAPGSRQTALAVDFDGLLRQDFGGQRIKTRTDAGAAVTADPRTDFAIACTNVGAITLTLPAGVDGMSYLISASSGSGGVTLTPTGDVVDNNAVAAGATRYIYFNTGVWY